MKKDILAQIKDITSKLLSGALQIDYNESIITGQSKEEITWANSKNIAFTLKNKSYEEIYREIDKERDYNFKMLDSAVVQMKYRFYKNDVIEHILAYYPNPNIEGFKDNPEDYERDYYGNKLFSEISSKKIVVFPIRFDYSQAFTDCEHPFVHATFGNYESCRIPAFAPISPNRFILFILRSFYFEKFAEVFNDDFEKKCQKGINEIDSNKRLSKEEKEKNVLKIKNEFLNSLFACELKFSQTISQNEKKMIHFNFEL